MRRSAVVLGCVLMLLPWPAHAGDGDETEVSREGLRRAHEALREAVEKIRGYHQTHGPWYSQFVVDLDKPRLGVVVEPVEEGVRVVAVTPGGPAEEAGIQSGDVITRIDGLDLTGGSEAPHAVLVERVDELQEGDTPTLDYLREGVARTTTVTVRPLEGAHFWGGDFHRFPRLQEDQAWSRAGSPRWFFPHGWLDMELVSLNPDLAEYFGTDEGVLVVRAPQGAEVDLKGGDVIISIDNRVVKSPTHAIRILSSYEPEERMTLEIVRRGRRETIEAIVPEHRATYFDWGWHEESED
jgi:S1-C subfamily serine protease